MTTRLGEALLTGCTEDDHTGLGEDYSGFANLGS